MNPAFSHRAALLPVTTGRWWCVAVALLSLAMARGAEDSRLLLCGMDEVFMVDPATLGLNVPVKKLWSWRAKEREEVPAALRGAFGTTADCKALADGKQILITSSSGGCALVEYPSGEVRWQARVPNAHSIERLPRDRVVVAASVSSGGNRLVVFEVARSGEPLTEVPLVSAHGVVWDEQRQRLWAVGLAELQAYELKDWAGEKPALQLAASHPLPDGDGHDLQPVPGGDDLVVTTGQGVYLFDRAAATFRPHPALRGRKDVKSVSVHPVTGRVVFVQAEEGRWWSGTLRLLAPAAELPLAGERLYKARWFVAPEAVQTESK